MVSQRAAAAPGWAALLARALVLLGCGVALLVAALEARTLYRAHAPFMADDAYITLRYARHLADGLGPVWNAGERVEGYTSFLAVALIALLSRLGVALEDGALFLNLCGLALCVLVLLWHGLRAERTSARPAIALAPALLVGTYPPLHVWVHGRLEAPLFAGLVALALHATHRLLEAPHDRRRQAAAALALGLLPLTRPDGGAFGLVGAVFVGIACLRSDRTGVSAFARFAVLALLLPLAHVCARKLYYGEWVPNSVIAKATGLPSGHAFEAGRAYLAQFLEARPYFPQLAASLFPFALIDPRRRLGATFFAAAAAAYAALIVSSGGDHMVAHRLLLPAVVPLAFLVAEGLRGIASFPTQPRGVAPAAAAVLALAGFFLLTPGERYAGAEQPDPAAYVGRIMGEHLRDTYPDGTLVALNTAGSSPFFAPRLRFIDMLGLNDAHIARRRVERLETGPQGWPGHAKGDGAYVLSRRPDIIIIGPAEGTTQEHPWFLTDVELGRSPRFAEEYSLREVRVDVRERPHHRLIGATATGRVTLRVYERKQAE